MIDIAIIGGGMSGLTAGLYAARGGMNAALFEALMPGGQTATIFKLENYPGFPAGVDGAQLMLDTMRQAEQFGCAFHYQDILGLQAARQPDEPHTLLTAEGGREARTVIIASGAAPRQLGLPREQELTGRGVSYCATCDGALFRDKTVAVVGGGDTALTDALVLSRFAAKVLLIHRRDQFRGSRVLQDRVRELAAQGRIELHLQSVVSALLGENRLQALQLRSTQNNAESEVITDGLFVAVGIMPRSAFVSGLLKLNENGQIITGRHLETSVPGIFAAGDCRDTVLRQVVTAAADGAVAATSAIEYLSSLG